MGSAAAAPRNNDCTSLNRALRDKRERKKKKKIKIQYPFHTLAKESTVTWDQSNEIPYSGSSDPNLSLSFSLSCTPSLSFSLSLCSRICRYFGLCLSQSRSVSQACRCSDSLVKLTARAIKAVKLSFFNSIHLDAK